MHVGVKRQYDKKLKKIHTDKVPIVFVYVYSIKLTYDTRIGTGI